MLLTFHYLGPAKRTKKTVRLSLPNGRYGPVLFDMISELEDLLGCSVDLPPNS